MIELSNHGLEAGCKECHMAFRAQLPFIPRVAQCPECGGRMHVRRLYARTWRAFDWTPWSIPKQLQKLPMSEKLKYLKARYFTPQEPS